jgi:hypothetical protein
MKTDPPEATRANALLAVLKSESFVEKCLLLVLTAVLSGIVVPLIIKSVDSHREHRENLIRAQAKLFDDISETILTCETLMLDVSWFGTAQARNPEMQKKSFDRYVEQSVGLVAKWRAQSSRAETLVSPKISEKLAAFQIRFFREQDTPTNRLWTTCGTDCDWRPQHKTNENMLVEANGVVAELATDLGLTKN